ncbi:unnamed protein product [Spirodela intermedia]|uniref:Uncharacterized protein n=1 Tax=Spirodela intermedia TaxID=51605 RepID=A0A7I8IHT5_SPIIN|nr:unnamed protein product [Spirodela intermedia]CAA6657443.1 unnamed protein product [Spirodela intermedia]
MMPTSRHTGQCTELTPGPSHSFSYINGCHSLLLLNSGIGKAA